MTNAARLLRACLLLGAGLYSAGAGAASLRSATYLNLGDEGPHWETAGATRRDAWHAASAVPRNTFKVGGLAQPTLKMTRAQLVKTVANRKHPHLVDLVKRCRSWENGPCYTVTDEECEVSIAKDRRLLARGILRLRQSNGC